MTQQRSNDVADDRPDFLTDASTWKLWFTFVENYPPDEFDTQIHSKHSFLCFEFIQLISSLSRCSANIKTSNVQSALYRRSQSSRSRWLTAHL